ncbi:addiction module toxin, HicA family [Candidatus Roizmanbacteria bacterium]|nr:addiction module toxin, HicA family [Candidatus Roizmanbacteria bacterium]
MPKLPIVKSSQIIKILIKIGFKKIRQKGSHCFFFRKEDNKAVIVPIHNKDLGKGLTRKILNEINLSVEEFINWLHNHNK